MCERARTHTCTHTRGGWDKSQGITDTMGNIVASHFPSIIIKLPMSVLGP